MQRRAITTFALAASALLAAPGTWAQTKWDLPAAYPASNFHTENLTQFAKDIDTASGGKLKITVHANASLFKAPEIKRAVQSGQAQIGEILLANFANESPIYALDGVPFLATGYGDARKLYEASRPAMDKLLAGKTLSCRWCANAGRDPGKLRKYVQLPDGSQLSLRSLLDRPGRLVVHALEIEEDKR